MPGRSAKGRAYDAPPAGQAAAAQTQRLDKWLWFARVVKSRSLATAVVAAGKVRVNKVRITKPAQLVKPEDVVTVAVHGQVRVLRVVSAGERRGPPAEASTLFEDLSPPVPRSADAGAAPDAAGSDPAPPQRAPGVGRPTKRERRALDQFRGRGAPDDE